jgi:hypothetical protein
MKPQLGFVRNLPEGSPEIDRLAETEKRLVQEIDRLTRELAAFRKVALRRLAALWSEAEIENAKQQGG